MPEIHIDLDAPESTGGASRLARPPRWLVVTAVLTVVGGVIAVKTVEPSPPPVHLTEAPPQWTAGLALELGPPVMADFAEGVVVVTARNGLAAYDRVNGAELWRHDPGDGFEADLSGVTGDDVEMVPGAVVITDRDDVETTRYRVLDLDDGNLRFELAPEPPELPWTHYSHITTESLLFVGCRADACEMTAYGLDTGEARWRRALRLGTQVWPRPLVDWEHQGAAQAPFRPADSRPDPEARFFALVESTDGPGDRVETVDLATGETIGEWVAPQSGYTDYAVLGSRLLSTDHGHAGAVDPVTGKRLWSVEPYRDPNDPQRPAALLSGGKLLDSTGDGGLSRLLDLADGTVGPAFDGEHPLIARNGVAVTVSDAVARGTDMTSGAELWGTPLDAQAWEEFTESGAHADEDWLVIKGGFGLTPASAPWTYTVNLASGAVRALPVETLGYGGGQLLAVAAAEGRPGEHALVMVGMGGG
ncbi:PQQ-binding-like beta-propeller repeat protein [Phytomonospora sp. NPDC050363]|uniref:outer membrane protein assembly factor BamB family protein n=1 Tax=Phytomonospora sp. NPDC050363 TaxID=3155642 RepID=UPI0033E02EFA